MFHTATPPKFNVLVAAITSPSDPSKGINATVARGGFTLQQVVTKGGVGRVGGPVVTPPAPSALNHTAAIVVEDFTYWDPVNDTPPPFLLTEEVALFDRYIVAGQNFGAGEGGVGPVATIATELAASLNLYPEINAIAVGDTVYVTSLRAEPFLPIKATGDESVALTAAPFSIQVDGVALSAAPQLRKTFYVMKSEKTQSAPVSLP